MRGLAAIGMLVALAGCGGSPAIKKCEDYIVAKLRSPSTYKRISADGTAVPYESPTKYTVVIEYDAVNAYNAPVRDRQVCSYPVRGRKPVTDIYVDFDAEAEREAETIVANISPTVGFDILPENMSEGDLTNGEDP